MQVKQSNLSDLSTSRQYNQLLYNQLRSPSRKKDKINRFFPEPRGKGRGSRIPLHWCRPRDAADSETAVSNRNSSKCKDSRHNEVYGELGMTEVPEVTDVRDCVQREGIAEIFCSLSGRTKTYPDE